MSLEELERQPPQDQRSNAEDPHRHALLLFLHGLGGGVDTWGRFPDLIKGDPDLEGFDLAHFRYPSAPFGRPWRKIPRIQILAEGLNTEIENRYAHYPSIILVCHSLGGLVARRCLTYRVEATATGGEGTSRANISKVMLFATPNSGAGLADLASHFALWQPQLKQLCKNADFLDDLNRTWEALGVGSRFDVKYVVAGQDGVVTRDSAATLGGLRRKVEVLIGCDHRSCVKPASRSDLAYQVLKNFVLEAPPPKKPLAPAAFRRLKVVGFDLDGTLLRGLTFSWTEIWEHLGYSPDVPRAGMRRYLAGKCTYQEWCEWAVEKFRDKGLTRADLRKLAGSIRVTKNLHRAIARLKQADFAICLISGGIDVFLYEKIPDADDLFDEIFINRLEFDAEGLISGVDATPYDFQGKVQALTEIADAHGCTLEQTVFVGEGFNDAEASIGAGLSIAYPPTDTRHSMLAQVAIEDDDLMLVVDAILDRP